MERKLLNWQKNFLLLLKEFLEGESNLSAATVEAYERDLRQFFSFLEEKESQVLDIVNVTERIIRDYLSHLYHAGLAPLSVARKLSALKSFFRYLKDKGRLAEDPAENITAPQPRQKVSDVLSVKEIEALLVAATGVSRYSDSPKTSAFILRDQAMLEVLYSAGLRISELIGLKLSNLDLQEKSLRVTGLRNKERVLPLGEPAVISLRRYICGEEGRKKLLSPDKDSRNAIFLNCRGQPLSRMGAWRIIHACIEAAGIKRHVTPRTFRHSFAAHLLESGAKIRTVKEMLGHSLYIVTWTQYAHLRKTHKAFHPRP